MSRFLVCLLLLIAGSIAVPQASSCHGAVTVRVEPIVLSPDGIGRVTITAVDDAPQFAETLSSFVIGIDIRDLIMSSDRLQILGDGDAIVLRDNPDYVFAGQDVLLQNAVVNGTRDSLTVTDALEFTAPAPSLDTRVVLTEFLIGRQSGAALTTDASIVVDISDTSSFFDGSASPITGADLIIEDGPVTITAVPEPSTILLLSGIAVWSIRRTRRRGN